MLSDGEIKELRDVSIYSILGKQINGRRISMSCPFPNHRDSTPSFTVFPDNGFRCFGCGVCGKGAIDFCIALGYDFRQACEELGKYT